MDGWTDNMCQNYDHFLPWRGVLSNCSLGLCENNIAQHKMSDVYFPVMLELNIILEKQESHVPFSAAPFATSLVDIHSSIHSLCT